ncbi:hypothetical protein GCM10009847_10660 [Leucobacter tardus]|uniref:Uncharacterized protein n=1 Tax=Leucobacter tardus TaxID=501483 RepID=A0A939TQR7_9MICO|nr:hypothetical protein [Leucobacter tardus]MBO2989262.1 hypothetical protein [Leucobacter tardus]
MSEGTWYHLDDKGRPRKCAHIDTCTKEPHADSWQEAALVYEMQMEPYLIPPAVSKRRR